MLLLGRFFIRNHKAGNEIKKIRFASQKLNKKKSPVILVSCQRRSEWSILCRRSWKRRTKKTKKDFSGVRHVVTFRLDISSLYIVDFHPLCFALNNINCRMKKRFSFYSHRKPFTRRKCETWNRFLLSCEKPSTAMTTACGRGNSMLGWMTSYALDFSLLPFSILSSILINLDP